MPENSPPFAEIVIDAGCWRDQPDAEATIQRAIAAAARAAAIAGPAEVAVLLTDDTSIRALNSRFRGIDKPTNVLSFPASPGLPAEFNGGEPQMLGDIAIAYETLHREAEAESKPFLDHLSHLAVHGFLHLLGYDHVTDPDAEEMEAREVEILAQLGISNPYAERERMD